MFSIITVCYNAEKSIDTTLYSIISQKYNDYEIIIIDGGSYDSTLEIINSYSAKCNIRLYSEPDNGIYNAMNKGISLAKGSHVLFLNSGDYLYDADVLNRIEQYISNEPKAILYGRIVKYYPNLGSEYIENHEGEIEDRILEGGMPCHQAIIAPLDTLRNHYFCEKYKIRADYEWLMYSVVHNVKCVYIPEFIAFYDMAGISSGTLYLEQREEETREIIDEYSVLLKNKYYEKKSLIETKWRINAEKHLAMFLLMCRWVRLKQKNLNLSDYFINRGKTRIIIYGYSYVAESFIYEVGNSGLTIVCAIDKKAENKKSDITINTPDSPIPDADIIVVTAITSYREIKERLCMKTMIDVVSIEEVIEELEEIL